MRKSDCDYIKRQELGNSQYMVSSAAFHAHHSERKKRIGMDTTIVLSEQSTSQLTFTSICGESISSGLSGLENGNRVVDGSASLYADFSTKNGPGGILPRKAEPVGASSGADTYTLSRSQKLESSEMIGGGKLGGDEAERRYKLCLRAEIVGLCIVIVTVWGLLLLPIVFYRIPLASVRVMQTMA
jgi:hypothetical protein